MKRFFNSLQLQLYFVLLLFVVFLVIALLFNVRGITVAHEQQRFTDLVGNQRANSYLLASLIRRYEVAIDEEQQLNLEALIDSTIENIRETQTILREGDESLELPPLQDALLLPLLDKLDSEWERYITAIEEYIAEDQEEESAGEFREEEAAALAAIENQSVVVYTFANRLANGLSLALAIQLTFAQQVMTVLIVLTVLAVIFATFVVSRSTGAVDKLRHVAQEVAAENFTAKADVETFSEISEVGLAFNQMTERLSKLVGDLGTQVQVAEDSRQKAERSDQVKSAFLASMSHELRTPLNSVINFSKFLHRGMMGEVNEEQKETLTEIIDHSEHLLSLINDVLDMSKIESGSLNLFVEDEVDVYELLETVESTIQSLIKYEPIKLETEISQDLPAIRADRQRVLQILLNMASNAAKFTNEGHIRVKAACEADNLLFTIEDTGTGIAEADFADVFLAFKQTQTGLRRGGGTGLGMPISKSLAEAHGGKLWFTSEEGKGTSFYLSLPIRSDALVPNL